MSTNLSTTSSTMRHGFERKSEGPGTNGPFSTLRPRLARPTSDDQLEEDALTLVTFAAPTRAARFDPHELVCDCGHGQTLHPQRAHSHFARCLACDAILATGERTPRGDACSAFQGQLTY